MTHKFKIGDICYTSQKYCGSYKVKIIGFLPSSYESNVYIVEYQHKQDWSYLSEFELLTPEEFLIKNIIE